VLVLLLTGRTVYVNRLGLQPAVDEQDLASFQKDAHGAHPGLLAILDARDGVGFGDRHCKLGSEIFMRVKKGEKKGGICLMS